MVCNFSEKGMADRMVKYLKNIKEDIFLKCNILTASLHTSMLSEKETKINIYCKENDLLPRKRTELFLYIHEMMDTLVKNRGYHYFNGYELKN